MTSLLQRPLLWLFIIALSVGGCTRIFQNDQDAQARQALQDLMAIQEKFHQENKRFAKNLLEIEKYNLKYHTGIVYLEIESAGKDKYRAIALPAESTTARVFAFDTAKGGYYEMEEEEVAQYVLGALNHIRQQKSEKTIVDYLSAGMLICLFWFGIRMYTKYKEPRTLWVWAPYFLCLLPLSFSIAALNHMNKDTFLSPDLVTLMGVGFGLSVICLLTAGVGLIKVPKKGEYQILQGIAACAMLISLLNGVYLAKSYYDLSQPRTNTIFYKAS